MTDILNDQNGEQVSEEQKKPIPFRWILQLWFKPRKTLKEILDYEKGVWLVPVLFLSLLQIVKALIDGPIRAAAQLAAQQQTIPNAEFLGPDQINQMQQSASFTSGPIFTIVFPALIGVLGIWLGWLILGSVLHLSLTLAGNRNSSISALNLAAWSLLPGALRILVQIVATAASGSVISQPGLSGFVLPTGGMTAFISSFLGFLDIYLIWQIALIVIGGLLLGNIKPRMAWISTILSVLIVTMLQAIPGTVAYMLTGLSITRPFFF